MFDKLFLRFDKHDVHIIKFYEVKLLRRRIKKWAVYKSGTETRGRGHRDACVGTCDSGTRDEGLEDIKYVTRGRVGRGRWDAKYRDAEDAGCE